MRSFVTGLVTAGATLLLGVALPSRLAAQPGRVPGTHVAARPALDGVLALLGQTRLELSRDGRRVLSVQRDASTPDIETWRVVETTSGATVAAGPTVSRLALAGNAAMSPDGTKIAFVAAAGAVAEARVRDLTTGSETVRMTGVPGLSVQSLADSGVLLIVGQPLSAPELVAADGARRALLNPCPAVDGYTVDVATGPAALSDDGARVVYRRYRSRPPIGHSPSPAFAFDLVLADVATLSAQCLDDLNVLGRDSSAAVFATSDAGTLAVELSGFPSDGVLVDTATRRRSPLGSGRAFLGIRGISGDGRKVLVTDRPSTVSAPSLAALDPVTGVVEVLAEDSITSTVAATAMASDGKTVLFWLRDSTGVQRAFVASLDLDGDGLHDAWETTFGLNPADPTDSALDPDLDGLSSAQEYAAGSHPLATAVRYFAEGADGPFFATGLALFAPGEDLVVGNVRILGPDGTNTALPFRLPGRTPLSIAVGAFSLPASEFSLVVESPVPVVAERTMAWDRSQGYGAHTSNGAESPSLQWHFAEGATIAGIQTFFLLLNPGPTPAAVTMRYLLTTGAAQERVHVVPAHSRLTVWANQEGAPLEAAEFATTVIASAPVVAERATYRDADGQIFGAGAVASGVPVPATTWSFAEGATGPYFDTFLLVANPGDVPATVTIRYRRAGVHLSQDEDLTRTHVIAPRQRRTVWVDKEDARLEDTAVSSWLQSDVPVVAERAMWWPGPTAGTWHGAHVEAGSTAGATKWAVANVDVGTTPEVDTFVCVSHGGWLGALLRVTLYFPDGRQVTKDIAADSRFTLWPRYDFPESVGQRVAITIESLEVLLAASPGLPRGRPGLTVETVTYRGNFAAGGASMATRLPNPP